MSITNNLLYNKKEKIMRKLQKMFFELNERIESGIYNKQWDIVNSLRKTSAQMSKVLDSGKISTAQLEQFQAI